MEITIPLNIVIFFGIPMIYDLIFKRRSPAVWGIRSSNIGKSILYGIALAIGMFPVTYSIFKLLFNFTTEQFVQAGTLAHYFYSEFRYPINLLYYSLWTLFVVALGEELFFRGFIHNKLEQKFSFVCAALMSSIIFTASHIFSVLLFPLEMTFFYLILCFVTSFLLAYVLHSTRNLSGCWISHSVSNILAAIFIGML